MRERIGEEMSVDDTSLALLNDIQLLNSYYTCKYVLINRNDAVLWAFSNYFFFFFF
jgi:hypothetical protein